MRSLIKNKKGDFASLVIMLVVMFIVAISAVLGGKIITDVLHEFKQQPEIQNTTAFGAVETVEGKAIGWLDFLVFFSLFAMIIGIIISATMIDTHPSVIIVFIVGMFIIIFLSGILANAFSNITAEEEIAGTASQFTMTNIIIGQHFPIIMFVVTIIVIIILYGKSRGAV